MRSDLCVPRVFAIRQLYVEDQHDVACLSFLSDDDFLRAIDDEVASLVVHALLVSDDCLVVAIAQMALTTPDHHWNLSKVDLSFLVFFDQFTWLFPDSLSLFDVNVNLCIYLVRQVSNSSFVREIRIHLEVFVLHHWLVASVDLTKNNSIADVVFFLLRSGSILTVYTNKVALMLPDAVGYHVFDESVKGLNLLVNHSILFKVCIDDLPLVIYLNLVLSVVFYIWLRKVLAISCFSVLANT